MQSPFPTIFFCQYCQKPISESKRKNQMTGRRKYCSRACSETVVGNQVSDLNNRIKLTTGTIGAISELIVSADLMRRGYHVFRALSPACPCDLVAMRNGKVLRIEVRTATVNINGTIGYPKNSLETHEYDILALVIRGVEMQYIPELME